jgi:hypothetical protein
MRKMANDQKFHQHRQGKQFLAAQPVGQPAEKQRAANRADQIGTGGGPDLGATQVQGRAFGQRAGQRADDRDLQPVQYPGNAKGKNHQPVEPAPREAIEPVGDVGFVEISSFRHCPVSLSVAYFQAHSPEKLTDGCFRDLG